MFGPPAKIIEKGSKFCHTPNRQTPRNGQRLKILTKRRFSGCRRTVCTRVLFVRCIRFSIDRLQIAWLQLLFLNKNYISLIFIAAPSSRGAEDRQLVWLEHAEHRVSPERLHPRIPNSQHKIEHLPILRSLHQIDRQLKHEVKVGVLVAYLFLVWPDDDLLNIWPFTTMEIWSKAQRLSQVGSTFCQELN